MKSVWIGVVEVKAFVPSTVISAGRAAFVKTLAWVESVEEFQQVCTDSLRPLGLFPIDFCDMMPWKEFSNTAIPTDHFRNLSIEVETHRTVRFGKFMTFPEQDACGEKSDVW